MSSAQRKWNRDPGVSYSCKKSAHAAGILWENDREYPVAEALASVVIREKPLNRSQMRPSQKLR